MAAEVCLSCHYGLVKPLGDGEGGSLLLDKLESGGFPIGPQSEVLVSVCMPASRATQWFATALASVLDQDLDGLEVVVTDDSGGELEELVTCHGDPRIIYEANRSRLGFRENHARALARARGQFIAWLHDDDCWNPTYLSTAVAVLEEHPDVGLVISDALAITAEGQPIGLRSPLMPPGLQSDPLRSLLHRKFIAGIPSASVFRREALQANSRPWPDGPAGDLTMYIDCMLAGWKVYRVPEILVQYRLHATQISLDLPAMRTAVISVMDQYAFADLTYERLRVRRVASELVSRAAVRVRRGEMAQARGDLRAARELAPRERWWWSRTIQVVGLRHRRTYIAVEQSLRTARAFIRSAQRLLLSRQVFRQTRRPGVDTSAAS